MRTISNYLTAQSLFDNTSKRNPWEKGNSWVEPHVYNDSTWAVLKL